MYVIHVSGTCTCVCHISGARAHVYVIYQGRVHMCMSYISGMCMSYVGGTCTCVCHMSGARARIYIYIYHMSVVGAHVRCQVTFTLLRYISLLVICMYVVYFHTIKINISVLNC